MKELLKINNLTMALKGHKKNKNISTITQEVCLSLGEGETLGIIGESGCGKSITALSVMGLSAKEVVRQEGEIWLEGKALHDMPARELRKLCGSYMGMVFQEPMRALNPVFTIGKQMEETLKIHLKLTAKERLERCIELLENVGISEPKEILKAYPHELSGGMRQRVIIAIAISCKPKLLIADEPTTALDVTTQEQILRILKSLLEKEKMSLLLISHDMGVIAALSQKILVMYGGDVVEEGEKNEILNHASHPYTRCLIKGARELSENIEMLTIVKGNVPRPEEEKIGCLFAKRCDYCQDICRQQRPPLQLKENGQGKVRCFFPILEGE